MLVGRETIEALSWVQVDGVVGRLPQSTRTTA